MEKLYLHVSKIIKTVFFMLMVMTLSNLLLNEGIGYGRKKICKTRLPNWILLIFGVFLIVGIYTVLKHSKWLKKAIHSRKNWLTFLFYTAMFALQVYAIYNYYFYTGWDSKEVTKMVSSIVHDGDFSLANYYLSMYPNNTILVIVFSVIESIMHGLGLHAHEYTALLVFQSVICILTEYLFVKITRMLFQNDVITALGIAVYTFLVLWSPWVSIPYSDATGLLFPSLILYLYINNKKHGLLNYICLGLVSVIAYRIKPQTSIITIAIFIVECIDLLQSKSKAIVKRIACIVLGIGLSFSLTNFAISSYNFQINSEKTFGIKHFFMMGLNPKDGGVWSADDFTFSESFETREERDKANMEVAKQRIQEMGVSGLFTQIEKKTMTNYNDGTFCWGGEGSFFTEFIEEKDTPVCKFFRNLYYPEGNYYYTWKNFVQAIWLCVLVGGCLSYGSKDSRVFTVQLSIVGLTLFELLFEARARYLYTYVPLYIILFLSGVTVYIEHENKKKELER